VVRRLRPDREHASLELVRVLVGASVQRSGLQALPACCSLRCLVRLRHGPAAARLFVHPSCRSLSSALRSLAPLSRAHPLTRLLCQVFAAVWEEKMFGHEAVNVVWMVAWSTFWQVNSAPI
jgi:hypothetical protein